MGSVTYWIDRLKTGDPTAVEKLWDGYLQSFVGLEPRADQAIPRRADEEDVALSAFHSFCCGAEEGHFPWLSGGDDLWQLLVLLTARKAANLIQSERRQKRGGKVLNGSALQPDETDEEGKGFSDMVGREPDPGFAVQMAEQCSVLLDRLDDDTLRTIAVWKLEGHTNEGIAAKMGLSLGTVERKLRLIRGIWETEDLSEVSSSQ